ncbi:MAG: DUF2156 domain-containing protein [Bifidobacterium sp.]|uniref:bifunctional lysylphosphatidylglycerol flippase/synthetase MprF n=1 Tax=Bifidobacterium sp. TaxID=41200 RepID=UPI0039E75048
MNGTATSKRASRHSSWAPLGTDLRSWLSDHLFAIIITGIFVAANIVRWIWLAVLRLSVAASTPSPNAMRRPTMPGAGAGHGANPANAQDFLFAQFTHLLESTFFVHGPIALLIFAALLLGGIGFAQSRFGTARTAVLLVVNTVAGIALGLLVCVLVNRPLVNWIWLRHVTVSLSPFILVAGVVMAASAFTSALWQRRITLLCYAFVSAELLFSGNPGDYCTLAVVVLGHIAGRLLRRYDQRDAQSMSPAERADEAARTMWWRGTDYEMRRLLAAVQLILAVGPVLAITSHIHAGILTNLGLFMSNSFGDDTLMNVCTANNSASSCIALAGVHHAALLVVWIGVLLPVAALATVAWGLYRGRRLAAWTSILFNTATALFVLIDYLVFPLVFNLTDKAAEHHYALTPDFIVTTLPPLILAIMIARNLAHFPVPTTRRHILRGSIAVAAGALALGIVYVFAGLTHPRDFVPKARFSTLVLDILHRFLPVGFAGRITPTLRPRTIGMSMLAQLLTVALWLIVLAVFLLWFRDSPDSSGRGRTAAGRLVEQDGESMSFMTTWEGNRYWFSASGRSAIAYRVLHGVALTVTGPFGDPTEYASSLREFIRFCARQSWSPAFYAVHEAMREELERLGCSCMKVGTEMIVIPGQWQTKGKKWQDIRTAINKAKRSGVTDVLTTFEGAGWTVQQQIVGISEQWAQLKALPEMKFTLGGVEELSDERVALLYAVDADGVVQGVTSWMPTYRGGRVIGWTLDFMRHRTDSPNGIMEFLIARMAERLRDEGEKDPAHAAEFMSLSAAPLAGLGGEDTQSTADAEIIEHAMQIVADMLEPAYGFKSLFFFKRKFQPEEAPIYLCYPDPAKLAQIGLAVVSAYVPEFKASQIAEMLKTMRG